MTADSTYRALALANIALCVPVGLYFRVRSATGERLDRREEGPFVMVGLRLCGLLAWAAFVAYLVNPAWMRWSSLGLPDWLRRAGAALGLFVVPPALFWTFRSLGNNLTDTCVTRRDHTLITHGPYHWVRHPFYDVVFLWGLSLSLLTANWLIALLTFAVAAMQASRTRVEEAKLADRFGEEYRAYRGRTGRFLPLLRRSPDDGPVSPGQSMVG